MRVRITPGGKVEGSARVPGDKSVAHRWLILAATAEGTSALVEVPGSLDVRSTARCLAAVAPNARGALERWASNDAPATEGQGSTWNPTVVQPPGAALEVEGEGRAGLVEAAHDLDCENSGTSARLLAGLVAASPFRSVLTGDASLRDRPMERVAEPLRAMGARIRTTEGHAPLTIDGGNLRGITYPIPIPTAQVKSSVLLAGLAADGTTTVIEPAATRDHTERAIAALGGPVHVEEGAVSVEGRAVSVGGKAVSVERFQHEGFHGVVPGDPSSAAFLIGAAALTGGELTIENVGLNPSRLYFLEVMDRLGIHTESRIERDEVGEPVGDLWVAPCDGIRSTRIEEAELPLIIDEVPVLAMLAAHAGGDSWFLGAGELRVKESDRLAGVAEAIARLGGHAAAEGDDLIVAGGGLEGGIARAAGDHRMAMAAAVAGLAAQRPVEVEGMEAADVSFPGFLAMLRDLGATVEVTAS